MRRNSRRSLSPRTLGASHYGRRLPATGCDGSSSSTRQAIGAWKAGPVLGDLVQEAWSDRSRSSAGYVGHDAGCCDALSCRRVLPGQPDRSEAAKHGPGHKSPHAGAGRRHGTARSQGARKALGRPARPPGAVATPPLGSPSTAPASCRFILTDSRSSRVSGRHGACARGWPARTGAGPAVAGRARLRALKNSWGAVAQRIAPLRGWIGAIRLRLLRTTGRGPHRVG